VQLRSQSINERQKATSPETPVARADGGAGYAAQNEALRPGLAGMLHDRQASLLKPRGHEPPSEPLVGCDTDRAHLEYDYDVERMWNRASIASYRRSTRYYHVPLHIKQRYDARAGRDDLVAKELYDRREANGSLWWEYCTDDPNYTEVSIPCTGSGAFDGPIETPAAKGTFEIAYDTLSEADRIDVFGDGSTPIFTTGGLVATQPADAAPLGDKGVVKSESVAYETGGTPLRLKVTPKSDGSIWSIRVMFKTTSAASYSSDAKYNPIDATGRDLR
jgi:hypothetical protein